MRQGLGSRATTRSWLVAVARNHSLDVLRARKRQSDDIDMALDVADAGRTPEKAAAWQGWKHGGAHRV